MLHCACLSSITVLFVSCCICVDIINMIVLYKPIIHLHGRCLPSMDVFCCTCSCLYRLNIILKAGFTRDGVGVVSGFMSATESECEESERFHFLLTQLTTSSITISENQMVRVGSRSGG